MGIPDVDIHPVATGPAAKLVAQHQNLQQQTPLVLYSGWFCPFVQRSWITLEELGLKYEYVEINPYKKEKEFLQLNPRGLVPTLGCPVDGAHNGVANTNAKAENGDGQDAGRGGKVGHDGIERKPLIESNIICEYLDMYAQMHPEEVGKTSGAANGGGGGGAIKGSLFPVDLYERARVKIWVDFVGSRIIPAFHRLLQHTDKATYSLEDALEEVRGHLKTWIKEADSEGPYFLSKNAMGRGQEDGFCMADVALAPWAVRLWVMEHYKGVKVVPEKSKGKAEDEALWERWRTWASAIEGRKSVSDTLSEKEHYLPIYQRYADDKAESELAKATRQGRGVP